MSTGGHTAGHTTRQKYPAQQRAGKPRSKSLSPVKVLMYIPAVVLTAFSLFVIGYFAFASLTAAK